MLRRLNMSKIKKSAHSSEVASSSSGSSSSLSSDEEVDARDLKPIKEYLSDRKELARQLFKSVKAEKIQLMLPQTLKKIDFNQLETWCANELSGMSKSRILCILNGKPMLESSDTSESNDSGPSLEIISDTEEWFTDEDICKQEEGLKMAKGKVKKERSKQKGKIQVNRKNDNKPNPAKISGNLYKNVQVKKEDDTVKDKDKEGDSLLDLLELEMRARAIRALIRKEEDIIPNASESTKSNDTPNEKSTAKAEQDEKKEKENCRRQLERIISAQQNSTAEDEDVVLVVQPTPTIELLSSDSEGEPHSGVRVNKKLENERVMEASDDINHIETGDSNNVHNVSSVKNSKEDTITKSTTESREEADAAHKDEVCKHTHNDSVLHKDKESHKRRKSKKKSHTKEQLKSTAAQVVTHTNDNQKEINMGENLALQTVKPNEKEPECSIKVKVACDNSLSGNSAQSGAPSKATLDEEKSIDLDEIIDLDNYCDDMEDMENTESNKNKKEHPPENKPCISQISVNPAQKPNGTETWASRYYQTDDVQNVIKESKIQSEIRKRLRERQRLSKLVSSPNKNTPSSPPVVDVASNKNTEKNPKGSVDEYLALKHTATTSHSTTDTNNEPGTVKDNVVFTNACADISTLRENDHTFGAYSKIQKIDKEIALNDNTNSHSVVTVKIADAVDAVNVTNPS